MQFGVEFDVWPGNSTEHEKAMSPYYNSMLKLRHHYPSVFRKQWLLENENRTNNSQKKWRKINYFLNLLPNVSEV